MISNRTKLIRKMQRSGLKRITAVMVSREREEGEKPLQVPCSRCGKPTTPDPTYGDLCYRCVRANNE